MLFGRSARSLREKAAPQRPPRRHRIVGGVDVQHHLVGAGTAQLLDPGGDLVGTSAGATDVKMLGQLERLVGGLRLLPVDAALDYRDAATAYRAVRANGETVRRMLEPRR
jgi:hypothetical protein